MPGRLVDPCPIGQHEPCQIRRVDALLSNRCGKCGREIERETAEGGPKDPWMTADQHRELIRELEADEKIGQSTAEERTPPRE